MLISLTKWVTLIKTMILDLFIEAQWRCSQRTLSKTRRRILIIGPLVSLSKILQQLLVQECLLVSTRLYVPSMSIIHLRIKRTKITFKSLDQALTGFVMELLIWSQVVIEIKSMLIWALKQTLSMTTKMPIKKSHWRERTLMSLIL